MNKQFKNDKHAKLSPGREDIHQDDFNAKVIPCWQTMCAVHIDSMFEQKLVIHIEEEVEKLVHVLFHGLTSHEAPHVNLCTFLANPPNTSQSLALVGHCRAQGIGIHRMDEDHMIGSRQVGTRSRVLQGQQQNKGLLIIKVGHGFQTLCIYIGIFLCQMFVGVCWRFQPKRGSCKPSRV